MASIQRLLGDDIAGNLLKLASGGRVDVQNIDAMSIFLDALTESPLSSPIPASKSKSIVTCKWFTAF